jgi:hypothetical protein
MTSNKLVHGVGINDANYKVTDRANRNLPITWRCPYYVTWSSMLARCFSKSFKKANPAYEGCTVTSNWLKFSNFRSWMQTQDWQGKELDKDLLFAGNKLYSPEMCVFLEAKINSFISEI